MKSELSYVEKFRGLTDPVRTATRAPGAGTFTRRTVSFRLAEATQAALLGISRGGDAALRAILTWAVAAYMRKVGRGESIVVAVPCPTSVGCYSPLLCDVQLERPAMVSLVQVRNELEVLTQAECLDLQQTLSRLGVSIDVEADRDNGLCDTAVVLSDGEQALSVPPSIALCVHFVRDTAGLRGELLWRSDCFEAKDVEVIPVHLDMLLGVLSNGMSQPLAGVSILSPQEHSDLVIEPNRTRVSVDGPQSIPAAFAATVSERPDSTAMIVGDKRISFGALAARAERVACALLSSGVEPGAHIALMVRRDEWLLPALLGILRAGCAYVPLDPDYPKERVRQILADCDAAAVVLSTGLELPEGAPPAIRLSDVSSTSQPLMQLPTVGGDDRAYLIYTSGSTGTPKGVPIKHRHVINFFAGMDAVIPRSSEDTWLAITSISFDISVLELLYTVCRGMRVILQEPCRFIDADTDLAKDGGPQFSLFFFADVDAEAAQAQYDLLFRAAEFADREGFEAVWVPERHFHRFGGLFPNPSLAAAALAARTKSLGLRAGSVVLPLHHPLRVAEEWAFVDNISNGRVGVSFASGWNPRDFVLAPDAYADRRQTLYRDVQLVRQFWRGSPVTMRGGNKDHEVELHPKPIQTDLPVWITASDSLETFVKAGEIGANVLTHLLHHALEPLKEKLAAYRESWRKHQGPEAQGKVTLMVHTFVGDSQQQVRAAVREPFTRYLKSSAELMQAALPAGLEGAQLSDADQEAMVDAAFEKYFKERGLFGTPEECLDKVRQLQLIGVDEIACLVDFIPDQTLVYDHLQHLSALQALTRRGQLDIPGQIETHKVTHFQCTPALARALMESSRFRRNLHHLRAFAIGGEAFPRGLAESVRAVANTTVLNMYGPTETTIWSTVHRVEESDEQEIPIGRPIANTRVYVLAPDLTPLPANRAGELCIGGSGVAATYWRRPELSLEKFVPDPFSTDAEARLYRTGDLVEWTHDRRLRFLGRVDRQVKVRGYRVELGEVECRLRDVVGIKDCVVVRREVGSAAHLCAYYRAEASYKEVNLKQVLEEALPTYMVPDYFVRLNAFPMTPNRKVDIGALPDPRACSTGINSQVRQGSTEPAASENLAPAQATLLEIWRRVLGNSQLRPSDDFFRSGGDSIQAIQAAAQANAAGHRVTPKLIYDHPTVLKLSAAVASERPVASDVWPEGPVALLPAQRWFFNMRIPNRNRWNQSLLLKLHRGVDKDYLREAVSAAFARHPAFRLRFRAQGQSWIQEYVGIGPVVAYRFFDTAAAAQVPLSLGELANEALTSIDLAKGPLASAVHAVGYDAGEYLILTAHHLVVDGFSWRVLLGDIGDAYKLLVGGGSLALSVAAGPHLAVRNAVDMASPAAHAAADFWRSRLMSCPQQPWPNCGEWREKQCTTKVHLSVGVTEDAVRQASENLRANPEIILLTALVHALRSAGVAQAIGVDVEAHGRDSGTAHQDGALAVGWLTRLYPIQLPGGTNDLAAAFRDVKAELRAVGPHKDWFEDIQWINDGSCPDEKGAAVKRAQIIFNYLGRPEATIRGSDLFESLQMSPGAPRDLGATRHHVLEVNVHQEEAGMVWELLFPLELLPAGFVESLCQSCDESLRQLLAVTPQSSVGYLIAEDFAGTSLTDDEVKALATSPGGLSDAFLATPQQRSMMFQLHACPADRGRFIHQTLIAVEGCDDEDRLEQALRLAANHHGACRSAFTLSKAAALVQIVRHEAPIPIRRLDWSDKPRAVQDAHLGALQKVDLDQGMVLDRAPLLRYAIVRKGPGQCWLLCTYHHLIADGWSISLLLRDIQESYKTREAPTSSAGEFGSFARWSQQLDPSAQKEFWRRYMQDLPPPAPLSQHGRKADFSRVVSYGVHRATVRSETLAQLNRCARSEGVTLPVVLQTAWGMALCRLSDTREAVFGITVAGRPPEVTGVEHTVGLFIGSVPLRFQWANGDGRPELLRRVHQQGAIVRENAYVESSFISRAMGLDGGQIPFETVMVLQNFVSTAELSSDCLRFDVINFVERNPVPLTIEVSQPDEELLLQYVFDQRYFDNDRMREVDRALQGELAELAGAGDAVDTRHEPTRDEASEVSADLAPVGTTL